MVPSAEGAIEPELEAAFRNSGLEIRPDTEPAVMFAVGRLAYFSTYQPPPSSPQFRKVGYKNARKQLDDLAASADTLIDRFEALSKTAFDALADHEFQVGAQRWIAKTLSDLSALAITARRADVSNVRERGREKNKRANGAARIVVDAFEAISGCDADKPANISKKHDHDKPRGLEPLVRKMFDVLHIKGNAKAAIEAALKERRDQGQQNPREPRETKGEDIFERMQHTELAMRGPRFWKKNSPPNNH